MGVARESVVSARRCRIVSLDQHVARVEVAEAHAQQSHAVVGVELDQRVDSGSTELGYRANEVATEDHIGRTSISPPRVVTPRPNDQVGEAVVVNVPRRGDRTAGAVRSDLADNLEAKVTRSAMIRNRSLESSCSSDFSFT